MRVWTRLVIAILCSTMLPVLGSSSPDQASATTDTEISMPSPCDSAEIGGDLLAVLESPKPYPAQTQLLQDLHGGQGLRRLLYLKRQDLSSAARLCLQRVSWEAGKQQVAVQQSCVTRIHSSFAVRTGQNSPAVSVRQALQSPV